VEALERKVSKQATTKIEMKKEEKAETQAKASQHETKREQRTQADTDFRKNFKKLIEKEFKIEENGEQKVLIRSRKNPSQILATKIRGVVYGDGGPYFECEKEDVVPQELKVTEHSYFFALKYTEDKSVKVYVQKKTVAERPNPPPNSRYRDIRNRNQGYADYKVGKYYFSPDEVLVEKNGEIFPSNVIPMYEMLEKSADILTEETKKRNRSLIFQNCMHETGMGLIAHLVQQQVVEDRSIECVKFERIGKKVEGKIQSVRVEFKNSKQAEAVFENRGKVQHSKLFIHRDLTPQQLQASFLNRTMNNYRQPKPTPTPTTKPLLSVAQPPRSFPAPALLNKPSPPMHAPHLNFPFPMPQYPPMFIPPPLPQFSNYFAPKPSQPPVPYYKKVHTSVQKTHTKQQ